jgi:hypothetical protein
MATEAAHRHRGMDNLALRLVGVAGEALFLLYTLVQRYRMLAGKRRKSQAQENSQYKNAIKGTGASVREVTYYIGKHVCLCSQSYGNQSPMSSGKST